MPKQNQDAKPPGKGSLKSSSPDGARESVETAASGSELSVAQLWHHNGDQVIGFIENIIEPNERSRELSRS